MDDIKKLYTTIVVTVSNEVSYLKFAEPSFIPID